VLTSIAGRIVEWWDLTVGHARHAPPPDDRRLALDAFEQVLERFLAKLGSLTADDADAWCRALVEEHACDFPAAARWALYEDLTREAARRRRV
jgi:hypothetical protein